MTIRFPAYANGPDGSANGGFACGALAVSVAPPAGAGVEVILRKPPPLEVDLAVRRGELLDGEVLIAESRPVERLAGDVPAVRPVEAEHAQTRYFGFVEHAFPRCFTCGPERAEGSGLQIYPGAVGRDGVVACIWEPHPAFVGPDGTVDPVVVWAALDCPSGIAVIEQSGKPAVLGRFAAQLHGPVQGGRRYVVVGWPREGAGRRSLPAASAILDGDRVVARAEAVWVSVDVPLHSTAEAQRTDPSDRPTSSGGA